MSINTSPKYIYSLSQLLANDAKTINGMCNDIKIRGFTFLSFASQSHDELKNLVDRTVDEMNNFFTQDENYKNLYSKEPIFGYFSVPHKESYRLLTGSRMKEHRIPHNMMNTIKLAKKMDNLMLKISLGLAPTLFPDIIRDAKRYNITAFDAKNPWSMFDITKYHNNGTKKGLNCDPHTDPGLLSLHIKSTSPGLQLRDENGIWINPPSDDYVAILWTGDVAQQINPMIKPCYHRVLDSKNKNIPRMGIWYEICTKEQEHTELVAVDQNVKKSKESLTGISISKTR